MKNIFIVFSFLSIIAFLSFTNKTKKYTEISSNQKSKDCDSIEGMEKIICLINAFKATLSSPQIANLEIEYTKDNIQIWSNLPAAISPRLGLKIGELSNDQLFAAKALIKEITGSTPNEGWDEIQQIWMADDFLNTKEPGGKYGAGNFFIAFLGTPSMNGTFEILLTGHHYTIANTYKNGKLAGATPRFEAVEPFSFVLDGKTYAPISQERDAMSALLNSLTEKQSIEAKSTNIFTNIFLKPLNNWEFPEKRTGLQLNGLSSAQKQLVINVIKTYTDDISDNDAHVILAKYLSELNDTYITYSGAKTLSTQNDYFRIDGPHIWIELSVQRGQVLPNEPYHFHSIWRDRESDYGGTRN